MVTTTDVAGVLNTVPAGTTLTITEIQELVEKTLGLEAEDLEPYTTSRPTEYPKWKHRIQTTLARHKEKGLVVHHPETNSYTV